MLGVRQSFLHRVERLYKNSPNSAHPKCLFSSPKNHILLRLKETYFSLALCAVRVLRPNSRNFFCALSKQEPKSSRNSKNPLTRAFIDSSSPVVPQ